MSISSENPRTSLNADAENNVNAFKMSAGDEEANPQLRQSRSSIVRGVFGTSDKRNHLAASFIGGVVVVCSLALMITAIALMWSSWYIVFLSFILFAATVYAWVVGVVANKTNSWQHVWVILMLLFINIAGICVVVGVYHDLNADHYTYPVHAYVNFNVGNAVTQLSEAKLTQESSGADVRITGSIHGDVSNFTDGNHGFHIHTYGVSTHCSDAGGHYNPYNKDHGDHVGDVGNISFSSGSSTFDITNTNGKVRLTGLHNVIGRAIVVHQNEDTGPSTSGNRILCGTIMLSES